VSAHDRVNTQVDPYGWDGWHKPPKEGEALNRKADRILEKDEDSL